MSTTDQHLDTVRVYPALPEHVPALLCMKRQLQIAEKSELVLRATETDWLRDGFGANPRFTAFVAERSSALVGMVTCSERYYTGWAGSTMYVQDMYVVPECRRRGIGKKLLARVAVHALERNCPLVELTVRKDSSARRLYEALGFTRVRRSAAYVAGIPAMTALSASFPELTASLCLPLLFSAGKDWR